MSELSQLVAIDILTHAIGYQEKQFDVRADSRPNFDARKILIESLSRVLDEVSVWPVATTRPEDEVPY
jgi:hypothetical protein